MAVDLSGYKKGDRVPCVLRNKEHDVVLVGFGDENGWPHFVLNAEVTVDDNGVHSAKHVAGDEWDVVEILSQATLKAPSDITAADLDGRLIETDDGGKVLFADGGALIWCGSNGICGTTWKLGSEPEWCDYGPPEVVIAAYLAELERRRNPPVEIVWQGECRDDDGTLLSAWCEVRGEKWRINRYNCGDYSIYRGTKHFCDRPDVATCEQYIRDHYASKDRAAEPA